jgi:hypothetical protein
MVCWGGYTTHTQFLWMPLLTLSSSSHIRNFIVCCCSAMIGATRHGQSQAKNKIRRFCQLTEGGTIYLTGPSVTYSHSFQERIVRHSPDLCGSLLLLIIVYRALHKPLPRHRGQWLWCSLWLALCPQKFGLVPSKIPFTFSICQGHAQLKWPWKWVPYNFLMSSPEYR